MIPILFVTAFVLTFAGIKVFISWSGKRKILDIPNERSSHAAPVPVGAGLVISAVVLIASVAGGALPLVLDGKLNGTAVTVFVISSVALVLVSWLDDIRSISVVYRLAVHSIAAAAMLYTFRGWTSVFQNEYLSALCAFLWIVGLTNAYNFMDGIDGIAGIQAVTAGIGWFLIGATFGSGLTAAFGVTLVASNLAFLLFNWEPAKTFMGDSGSAFIGFALAAAPLLFFADSPGGKPQEIALVSLAFVWPFVFDSALTFFRRLLRGERVWEPHRRHLYQAMVINGWGHSRVAGLYGLAGCLCTTAAFGFIKGWWGFLYLVAVMSAVSVVLVLATILSGRNSAADNE